MLNHIIAFSLRRRGLVLLLSLGLAVYGVVRALQLPIDVLPDLNRPTVSVLTEAHGMTPEDIEQRITRPIELAVNGAPGVTRVRSTSGMGLSVVFVEFDWDSDLYRSRQIVQEKLQLARERLPEDALPALGPISSLMGQIQVIGLSSKDGSSDVTELRAFADQVLKLRLLSLPGVSQVLVTGGAPQQLQVHLDSGRMRALGVGLEALTEAIRRSDHVASGGVLQLGHDGPLLQVDGRIDGAESLAKTVVKPDPSRPIVLGDVARVEFGPSAIRVGDAGVNGGPGCLIVIAKQPGVDTVELTRRVEAALARTAMPEDYALDTGIFRQADFIERAVDNVTEAVRDGAILVLIVLFLFLANLRTTLITLTAIPLSVAVTALFFMWFGITINTMTLGGLAVAVGALVDDAIVDVENVFRRLRQNHAKGSPIHALRVVFRASAEVRQPILIGTLVVTAVYLPLFALTGMEGRLFTPIGLTYIVSIMASLIVSLTVTPVLCYYLLPKSKAIAEPKDSRVVRTLKRGAEAAIRTSLKAPNAITALLMALVLCGGFVLALRGSEFLPAFNEGSAQVNLFLPPGTNLETSNAFGRRLEKVVLGVTGVASVGRRTGRAEDDEHAMGIETTEMILTFDPESKRSRDEMLAELRERVGEAFPGASIEVEQPLAHLLSHLLSGVAAQVAIKISGDDLAILRRFAERIEGAISGVPGVVNANVEPIAMVEQIQVEPDRAALARLGLSVSDIAEAVEIAFEGQRVGSYREGDFVFPVVVRLREEDRRDPHAVRSLIVREASGGAGHDAKEHGADDSGQRPNAVRLGDVARVRRAAGPNGVQRENARRRLVVRHNVQDRSLTATVADVERAIETIRKDLPEGYSLSLSGQFEAQQEAARVIAILSVVSLGLMFLLIYGHFRSVNLTLQTLLNIPMAFVGAVAMILLSGQTLSIATLVGLISLGGIAARNKILLVDHYLHLMAEEGEEFSQDMILRAGKERIVPVLMTALTSGLALLPLILAPDQPGRELLYPVASVIVGGLITTTLLDLLLTPGVFWLFGRRAAETVARRRRREIDPDDSALHWREHDAAID